MAAGIQLKAFPAMSAHLCPASASSRLKPTTSALKGAVLAKISMALSGILKQQIGLTAVFRQYRNLMAYIASSIGAVVLGDGMPATTSSHVASPQTSTQLDRINLEVMLV